MTVEVFDEPTVFALRDWTPLVEADPEGTIFHTPGFLKAYWEELSEGELRVAVVRHGSEPVAAAAMEVVGRRLRWLGGLDVTDYMGPVGVPEARDRAAKELMTAVSDWEDWDRAELGGLPEDGAWLPALVGAAGEAGLPAEVEKGGVAPMLSLPGTFRDYLASLTGKLRHEIRRKERRLRERFPAARLVDASSAGEDLDSFVELHRASGGPKGRFMVPGMELFFRRLAAELIPTGALRLTFLMDGDRRMAGTLAFRDRARFRLYNSVFDPSFKEASPGTVLAAELIKACIDEGYEWFDFLKGDLEYKYRLGARPRRIMRLVLERRPA